MRETDKAGTIVRKWREEPVNAVGMRGSKNNGCALELGTMLMRTETGSWGSREGKRGEEAEQPGWGTQAKSVLGKGSSQRNTP